MDFLIIIYTSIKNSLFYNRNNKYNIIQILYIKIK